MASPNGPKQMSSRLATMKFMQRAAVRPDPSTPNGPPSKRQRLSTGTSTPGTPSDYEVVQAALAAEELKRTQALEKQAAAAGETKWYLSFREPEAGVAKTPPMKVVHAGFAVMDADGSDEEEEDLAVGRRRFGKAKEPEKANDSESDSGSDISEDDSDDDSDPAAALIRETKRAQAREARKAKKAAAEAESRRLAEERRNKNRPINLNNLHSISGGGGGRGGLSGRGGGGRGGLSGRVGSSGPMKCFTCEQVGHRAADCPQQKRKR